MNEHTEKLSPIEEKARELAREYMNVRGTPEKVLELACIKMAVWMKEEILKVIGDIPGTGSDFLECPIQAVREWSEK